MVQDVFRSHHVVAPKKFSYISRVKKEPFYQLHKPCFGRWSRDVGSVCRRGQYRRQMIFVNEDLVSGVELRRKTFVGGDLFQEFDRPEIEIDLQASLVLNDVRRSLLSALINQRIAIDCQHRPKHFEPTSIDVVWLDRSEYQKNVIVGKQIQSRMRNRARAREDHGTNQFLFVGPLD